MKLKRNEGKAKEQPQAGTHMARLLGIVNLGHQPGFTFNGQKIDSRWRIEYTYELVNHHMQDGRPFVVSEEFNNNDFENPKTGKMSTAVARCKSLCPEDPKAAFSDQRTLLGKPCMVTVSLNDNGYPKLMGQAAVTGVPMGMDVPELTNETYLFDPEDEDVDLDLFYRFPEFKQEKITSALNFEETALAKLLAEEEKY